MPINHLNVLRTCPNIPQGTIRYGEHEPSRCTHGLQLSLTAPHNSMTPPYHLTGPHPASIKPSHTPTITIIYPQPHNSFYFSHSLNSFFSLYLCRLASQLTLYFPISHLTMVSTRTKNKTAHPAAPVMTEAAKQKAGIKTKRRPKKVTKDETIRELRARLAISEDPGADSFSKDPLVCTSQLSLPSQH